MTSTIKVDNIQKVSDGSNIIKKCGSTITIGSSGQTVAVACGATTSGMGRTGTVDWCSTIYTNSPGTITSVNGKGYFINTTSGTVTVTLPSSPSAGDIIAVKDYARTFGCNKVTLCRNGSKMCGVCANTCLITTGQSITIIYVDGTKGWQAINDDAVGVLGTAFVAATGGAVTTSGDFKIHTFTSSGCFQVTNAGNAAGSNKISYVVVAGGGGGGAERGTTTSSGGGGAGGFREGKCSSDPYTASPLATTALAASVATFPITVGGGGAGGPASSPNDGDGTQGSPSIFSTITSTGGGYGSGRKCAPYTGGNGGSGGGAKQGNSAGPACGAGLGNTPPVSPPQGNNGGTSDEAIGGPTYLAGGGGGAGAVGGNPYTPSPLPTTGPGGAGVTSSITGSPVGRAGGGGAGLSSPSTGSRGAGTATDGGGAGQPGPGLDPSANATANTGGGGGGGMGTSPTPNSNSGGGTGGSGVVILRYRFQ